jgi:hypothetical protein
MFATYKVLFESKGELASTPYSAVGEYSGDVDLTEKVSRLANSDFWMPVTVDRYKVLEVTLPEWLSLAEYLNDEIGWNYLWRAYGVSPEWSESYQRGFKSMRTRYGEVGIYAAAKLLSTNLRSEFRKSLRNQLVTWLDTDADARSFDSPFSERQWRALCNEYVAREARSRSEAVYRNSHEWGVERLGVAAKEVA